MIVLSTELALSTCGPKFITLNIEVKEFAFSPDTMTVPAGAGEYEAACGIGCL